MGKLILTPNGQGISMTISLIRRAVVCAGIVALAISLVGRTAMAKKHKPPKCMDGDTAVFDGEVVEPGGVAALVPRLSPGGRLVVAYTSVDQDGAVARPVDWRVRHTNQIHAGLLGGWCKFHCRKE